MKAETKADRKPIAVLISDVHYSVPTLALADEAMCAAIRMANSKDLRLVVAGDLHDTKANLRGECVNVMLETFSLCHTPPFLLVGNHDKINEKSTDNSLNFLAPYCEIVSSPVRDLNIDSYLIPYYHDPEELKAYLKTVPKGSRLIMHQGVQKSNSGHYIQDKSALPAECFADFRVISGHYHTRQDIKCGRPRKGHVGLFSYIGNPYTLNYAEASDPEKGFQILYSDGSLEFVPTHLRKHIKFELTGYGFLNETIVPTLANPGDLLWVKIQGTQEQLSKINKQAVADKLHIAQDYRLELIPTDKIQVNNTLPNLTNSGLFDNIIDSLEHTEVDRKTRLKAMWRNLVPNRGGL